MSGWLFLALLALILAAVAAVGVWFESYISHEGRPRRYCGRHRWPSPAHPAHAAWLDMQRISDAQARADDRVIAELEAMLNEEAH